ncbi:MAG: hypothetical protein HY042_06820 [Spirochaetia bacterium]|nr:hypothetical protein [Spirochaetia bacterium]
MKSDKATIDRETRDNVISAYRNHLEERYTIKNVRRFEKLANFPDHKVLEIRGFFLERLYPEPAVRTQLESAFENLGTVLKSPRKLLPLVGTMASGIWKLGSLIPAAVSGGLHTLEAYIEIRRLETTMVKYAVKHNLTGRDLADDTVFARMIASIPDKDVQSFRRDTNKLFEALANTSLLTTTVEILRHSIDVMEKKKDLYSEPELAGIRLGSALLTEGLNLFVSLTPEEVHMLQHGVDTIEMDWIERMRHTAVTKAG